MCVCVWIHVKVYVCVFSSAALKLLFQTQSCCFRHMFLPHLWAPMGDPFTPELSLGKRSSMLATVMIFMGQTRLVAIGTLHSYPLWCCFSHVFFWSFFPHFYMVMGDPKTQPQRLTTKVLSLGPITMKKATPDSLQVHNPWNLMPSGGQNW